MSKAINPQVPGALSAIGDDQFPSTTTTKDLNVAFNKADSSGHELDENNLFSAAVSAAHDLGIPNSGVQSLFDALEAYGSAHGYTHDFDPKAQAHLQAFDAMDQLGDPAQSGAGLGDLLNLFNKAERNGGLMVQKLLDASASAVAADLGHAGDRAYTADVETQLIGIGQAFGYHAA